MEFIQKISGVFHHPISMCTVLDRLRTNGHSTSTVEGFLIRTEGYLDLLTTGWEEKTSI